MPLKTVFFLFLLLVVKYSHCMSLRQFFPWDEDYADAATTTTTTTRRPSSSNPYVPSAGPGLYPWDDDYGEPETAATRPQVTRPTARPSTTVVTTSKGEEIFPWDEDYADSAVPATSSLKPIPTFFTTYRPVPLPVFTTTPRPSPSDADQLPWDMDYPETTAGNSVTQPGQTTGVTPATVTSGTQPTERLPWDEDYPEPSTNASPTGTPTASRPTTHFPAATTTSGPFPWDHDYPDDPAEPVTRPTLRPVTLGTGTTEAYPWDDDYTESTSATSGPRPSQRPQTSTSGIPGAPPISSTTTQSSATFLYFPAPAPPPFLSGSFNASMMANFPCNEGSFFEQLQCLGQVLMSLG